MEPLPSFRFTKNKAVVQPVSKATNGLDDLRE